MTRRASRMCATPCWRSATAPTPSSARPAGCSTSALPPSGATRVADRIECDLDYETPAGAWIDATLGTLQTEIGEPEAGAVIHVDFARPAAGASAWSRARPFEAEITERIRLSGSRSTSDTWHVELSLEGAGIEYEPGDSLGFVPVNDPALVDQVLPASGLDGNARCARGCSSNTTSPR